MLQTGLSRRDVSGFIRSLNCFIPRLSAYLGSFEKLKNGLEEFAILLRRSLRGLVDRGSWGFVRVYGVWQRDG